MQLLSELPSFKNGDYSKALEEAYLKVDELLLTPDVNKKLQTYTDGESSSPWSMASDKVAISVGCTAVCALITPKEIYVANAGDSRCVVCLHNNDAREMSKDHKPDNPEEKSRIEAAGGFVEDN